MNSSSSEVPRYEITLDDIAAVWRPVTIRARLLVVDPATGEWVELDLVDEKPEILPNEVFGLQQRDWLALTFKGIEAHVARWEARLTPALTGDEEFYNKAAEPFDLKIRVRADRPLAQVPDPIEKRCRIVIPNPRGGLHWNWWAWAGHHTQYHAWGQDDPVHVEADGTDRVTLDVRYSRWVPVQNKVDTDATVFFSHNLPERSDGRPRVSEIRRVQPHLFQPDAKDRPWESDSRRRETSVWCGMCALPPDPTGSKFGDVSDIGYEFSGEVRVRVWNIEESETKLLRAEGFDEHGYPRGLVIPNHPHIHEDFIPIVALAPTLAVCHLEPELPLAADGTGHTVKFEALHRRDLGLGKPSTIRKGRIHWEIETSARWPNGVAGNPEASFASGLPGRIAADYITPKRTYRPDQEYHDLFRFHQWGAGERRHVQDVKVFLSPSLVGEVGAAKPGLRFRGQPPGRREVADKDEGRLDVDCAAGATPEVITGQVGRLRVKSGKQFSVRHGQLTPRVETEAAGIYVDVPEGRVTIEAGTGEEADRYRWQLPELTDGLVGHPTSRRVLQLPPDRSFDVSLDQDSLDVIEPFEKRLEASDVQPIHPFLVPGEWGAPGGDRQNVLVLLRDQRTVMGRHLAVCIPEDHKRAWCGTDILHEAVNGAARCNRLLALMFDDALGLVSELFWTAFDAALSLAELPKRLLKGNLKAYVNREWFKKVIDVSEDAVKTINKQMRLWAQAFDEATGTSGDWAIKTVSETVAGWIDSGQNLTRARMKAELRAALSVTPAVIHTTLAITQQRVDAFSHRLVSPVEFSRYRSAIEALDNEMAEYRRASQATSTLKSGRDLVLDSLGDLAKVGLFVAAIAVVASGPAAIAAIAAVVPYLTAVVSAGLAILGLRAGEAILSILYDIGSIEGFAHHYRALTLPLSEAASS